MVRFKLRQLQMNRLKDLIRFYDLLYTLKVKLEGTRNLESCNKRMEWPERGVYFFFEEGENRSDSGDGGRIVRVGTQALKTGGKSTLWGRLGQHRGIVKNGGGNHRGSVFRLHLGTAFKNRDDWPAEVVKNWGRGSNASSEIRAAELKLEQVVSNHIRQMPFLWLGVEDPHGPKSLRGYIECNAVALLSNFNAKEPLDEQSSSWLGKLADNKFVRRSGLWNVKFVEKDYDSRFLDTLENLVVT